MDRRRLNKLNDNMDPIPIFALHKQMTIALNNLKLMTANKYQAHVFFFRFNFGTEIRCSFHTLPGRLILVRWPLILILSLGSEITVFPDGPFVDLLFRGSMIRTKMVCGPVQWSLFQGPYLNRALGQIWNLHYSSLRSFHFLWLFRPSFFFGYKFLIFMSSLSSRFLFFLYLKVAFSFLQFFRAVSVFFSRFFYKSSLGCFIGR